MTFKGQNSRDIAVVHKNSLTLWVKTETQAKNKSLSFVQRRCLNGLLHELPYRRIGGRKQIKRRWSFSIFQRGSLFTLLIPFRFVGRTQRCHGLRELKPLRHMRDS